MGTIQESLACKTSKIPIQLSQFRNVRLLEEDGFLRVQAASQPRRRQLMDERPQLLAILDGGERMPIGDEVDAQVVLGQIERRRDASQIISQVRRARGFDACE